MWQVSDGKNWNIILVYSNKILLLLCVILILNYIGILENLQGLGNERNVLLKLKYNQYTINDYEIFCIITI